MNTKNHSRRRFIKQSATWALSTAAMGVAWERAAAQNPSTLPITCRDSHLTVAGKPDCWSAMKELGLAGVEAEVALDLGCPGLTHPDTKYRLDSDASIHALRKDLAENQMLITSFLLHNRFEQQLSKEVACIRQLVKAAQALNVKVIRIDVVPDRMKRDEFLPFAIKACREICELVQDTPIRFGVENHGNTTNDPAFLDKLFDGVASSHLGLTLDTANLYWFGHPLDDLYKIFEKYASVVYHTHCKSIRFPQEKKNVRRPMGWEYGKYNCPVYEGDIDFKRIVSILRAANYAGDLCIEDESLGKFPAEERKGVFIKEVEFLKKLA